VDHPKGLALFPAIFNTDLGEQYLPPDENGDKDDFQKAKKQTEKLKVTWISIVDMLKKFKPQIGQSQSIVFYYNQQVSERRSFRHVI